MKTILAMLVLTVSVGAMAQQGERIILNSKEVSVNSDRAILVRTAQTPDKVEVTFQVPMANSFCADTRTQYNPRICHRNDNVYTTREVCRNVTTTTPSTSTTPRGPRYNGTNPSGSNSTTTTRRVCTTERVLVTVRTIPYDCSYTTTYCARYATDVTRESDKVKIKFKDLPALGGSEEETFEISAQQRQRDGSNVVYDINVLTTVENREYEVKSKGILGFDSYVIQSK